MAPRTAKERLPPISRLPCARVAAPRHWTPRSAAARTLELLREEGTRAAAAGVLAETFYRRLALLERPLSEPLDEFGSSLSFRELSAADIDELGDHGPPDEFERRFAGGHLCLTGALDGRVVTFLWAARHEAPVDYLGCSLRLEEQELYLYDTRTVPDLRGRDFATACWAYAVRRFKAAGQARLLAAVLPENRAGLRPPEKVGFRRIGTIGRVGAAGRWVCFRRA